MIDKPTALSPALFTRASLYPGTHPPRPTDRVRDPVAGFPLLPPLSERILQAVWYDPAFRPDRLTTLDGEEVRVEDPGTWNLGPGPDFTGAVLCLGPARRRVCGDVEIHVRPSDWTAHGHAGDPRYRGVRAHVTFAPAPPPRAPLPPGAVRIALRDALAADPGFRFEAVDPTAYPFAVRRTPCACAEALADWTPEARGRFLDAAGEERLRRKTERFCELADERGFDQAFYEEAMSALGYRHNKAAFRRLAATVPVAELREESAGSPATACALLAGVAGLLPDTFKPEWDRETRDALRAAWDAWWKRRGRWERRRLPKGTWRLSGIRPANHPSRRLVAAACWFTRPVPLHTALSDAARHPPPSLLASALAWLDAPAAGYWARRLTWGGAVHPKPLALVGRMRAIAVFNNVAIPYLAGTARLPRHAQALMDALPVESGNELLRQTAHALFGPDHSSRLYRAGLRQQGLLQVFHDYCLPDRSACAACPLPGFLRRHRDLFHRTNA